MGPSTTDAEPLLADRAIKIDGLAWVCASATDATSARATVARTRDDSPLVDKQLGLRLTLLTIRPIAALIAAPGLHVFFAGIAEQDGATVTPPNDRPSLPARTTTRAKFPPT